MSESEARVGVRRPTEGTRPNRRLSTTRPQASSYPILAGRGITFELGSGDILLPTLGGLAGAALWGAIGVAKRYSLVTSNTPASAENSAARLRS